MRSLPRCLLSVVMLLITLASTTSLADELAAIAWTSLSEQQREVFISLEGRWDQLDPARQRSLLDRTDRLINVPETKRSEVINRLLSRRSSIQMDNQQQQRLANRTAHPDQANHRRSQLRTDTGHKPLSKPDHILMRENVREKLKDMTPEQREQAKQQHRQKAAQQRQMMQDRYRDRREKQGEREAIKQQMREMTPEERRAFIHQQRQSDSRTHNKPRQRDGQQGKGQNKREKGAKGDKKGQGNRVQGNGSNAESSEEDSSS